MRKERKKLPLDKSVLTFFLISFPTLLIIIVGFMSGSWNWIVQVAIAIYQFLILKQFIDNYYDLMELKK